MLRIERLDPADPQACAQWDRYVDQTPGGGFFHRAGWQSVMAQGLGHRTHYLMAMEHGALRGLLPLVLVKTRLFGCSLVSLPFASYAGLLVSDEEAASALEREAVRLAQTLGAEFLELRETQVRSDWPAQDLYVDFRMPIPAVLDDAMRAVPQKRRNMVRKAIKLGLTAVRDDSLERFYPAFATNARDHGTPTLSKRFFAALMQAFPNDCRILSVNDAGGQCISTIMCFFHKGEVLAHFAGETQAARRTAANDFKYWEVMRWAKDLGCTVFDIGRSKRGTGSFDFKSLWGFEAHALHYRYTLLKRAAIPQNNPNNPKYRLLIATWKRLPLPVANAIGPHVVRGLG